MTLPRVRDVDPAPPNLKGRWVCIITVTCAHLILSVELHVDGTRWSAYLRHATKIPFQTIIHSTNTNLRKSMFGINNPDPEFESRTYLSSQLN